MTSVGVDAIHAAHDDHVAAHAEHHEAIERGAGVTYAQREAQRAAEELGDDHPDHDQGE